MLGRYEEAIAPLKKGLQIFGPVGIVKNRNKKCFKYLYYDIQFLPHSFLDHL
jgi:hypothetical protein